MALKRIDELAMSRVLDGGVVALPAAPGYVVRVRVVNGRVVLDKITQEAYTKRHGEGGVGESVKPALDNP